VDYKLLYGLLKVWDQLVARPLEVSTSVIVHEVVQAINLIIEVFVRLNAKGH